MYRPKVSHIVDYIRTCKMIIYWLNNHFLFLDNIKKEVGSFKLTKLRLS